MSEDYTYDYDYDEELEVTETDLEEEEVVEATETAVSGRVTTEPAADEVEFKMLRDLNWYGEKLEAGETYTWPEDEFESLMYWVNLRTDRLQRVERL